jgi:lupus La protein
MVDDAGLDQKIVKQVEYYFGDINLPRDKFLQEEMKKDNGWIELTTMLKCNRLAQLTTDTEKIATALQPSELIDVSDDKLKIRRSPDAPLPDNTLEYWQEIKRRTAYVKGFDPDTKLDEIQSFLAPYGDVKNVVMRRLKQVKTFKGSVFATFVDRETAEKFVKDETSSTYNEKPLVKMLQDDYWQAKMKETKEKRQAEKQAKLAKKLEQIAEQDKASVQAKFEKGAVLEVAGLDPNETKYDELKTFFKSFGPVAFVAYETGDETARIRFSGSTEDVAKDAWEAAVKAGDGKVVFNEKELTGNVLEGEAEEKYWADFSKNKVTKQFGNKNQGRGKFGRGGKGGRGGKRNRSDGDEKMAKHTVFKEDDGEDAPSTEGSRKRSHGGDAESDAKKVKSEA